MGNNGRLMEAWGLSRASKLSEFCSVFMSFIFIIINLYYTIVVNL